MSKYRATLPLPFSVIAAFIICVVNLAAVPGASADGKQVTAATTSSHSTSQEPQRYTLKALIERAHKVYPGIEATKYDALSMQEKRKQATYAFAPKLRVEGLVAPTPEIRCLPNGQNCQGTDRVNFNVFQLNGILARIQLTLAMPLYSFGKLGAVKRLADAGISLKEAQTSAKTLDVERDVSKAYYGILFAKQVLSTIDDGEAYVKKAMAQIKKQLDSGDGDVTTSDLFRVETIAAEVTSRRAEAQAGLDLATNVLSVLVDIDPSDLVLANDKDFAMPHTEERSIAELSKLVISHRPEYAMVQAGLNASRAKVSLEKRKLLPNILLVGMLGYGYTSNIDDPQNFFLNDPFNFTSVGLGLALQWNLDLYAQISAIRGAGFDQIASDFKSEEAMLGMKLETKKAKISLEQSFAQYNAAKSGSKSARKWLAATTQSIGLGLAETKDLADALMAHFQQKLKYLKAIFDANNAQMDLNRSVGGLTSQSAYSTKN